MDMGVFYVTFYVFVFEYIDFFLKGRFLMEEFIEKFGRMIDYGLLGVYKRQKLYEENAESGFVTSLTKACAIGAFLNCKFGLCREGKHILPETEYQMFQMFQHPLAEIVDELPQPYKNAIMNEPVYYDCDSVLESAGNGQVNFTEEGYLLLSECCKLNSSRDKTDQIGEYIGQIVYEELCCGDYVQNRLFLMDFLNVYIPQNAILNCDVQNKFMKSFPNLFNKCFDENTRTVLYRCKHCGMILQEKKPGVFSCISKKCNAVLDQKIKIEMQGTGWVMNDIVARYIYYPGQLEKRIIKILESGQKAKTVKEYQLWPGKYEGIYDTWDFRVYMTDGRILLIDAKDVEHPHWLIHDSRTYQDGADFLYVVPDDKTKAYVDQINHHESCIGKVCCLRVRELKKLIGVK